MTATSNYQAGTETNQTQLSYGVETTWGTAPTTAFQAIRYTGETLSYTKTRARPSEINPTREVSAAVTQKQEAKGAINVALSYGTYDDFFSVMLGNDFGVAQVITGAAADITLTAGAPAVLSSATAGKFSAINVGQWIRLLGFTNAANNGYWYVTVKTTGGSPSLSLSGPNTAVTETPTLAAAQVRAQTVKNGTQFKSLFLQQKFSSTLWLRYPGLFVGGFTLNGGIGKFIDGSFDVMAQQELSGTTDASTGGVTLAPGGRVNDPVKGFSGVFLNGASFPAAVDSFTIKATNNNAAMEFNLGSPGAIGILMGAFEASGTLKAYFKDFVVYNQFLAETSGVLSFITGDNSGNSYAISMAVSTFNADAITSGGPDQPVYSNISFMADPAVGGGTMTIDKLAAV